MIESILTFFKDVGVSFIPLFIAIDAIGILPFILSLTQDMNPAERPRTIRYAMLTAFALGLVFIGIGKGIFFVLGIAIGDFLVAGGLILLVLAIRHLITGKFIELQPSVSKEMIGVVPIGTPLVVGPAVLTTLLLLTQQYSLGAVILSFVLNLVFAWLVFSQANRVVRLLREQGLRASSQIASLLLAAIAVMMIRQGLTEILM
ncbi:MAG TPA: MarC family protein [Dehalococcoidia bacterium]|nr:MarC family protein [Dehalococcoidia bacterium]